MLATKKKKTEFRTKELATRGISVEYINAEASITAWSCSLNFGSPFPKFWIRKVSQRNTPTTKGIGGQGHGILSNKGGSQQIIEDGVAWPLPSKFGLGKVLEISRILKTKFTLISGLFSFFLFWKLPFLCTRVVLCVFCVLTWKGTRAALHGQNPNNRNFCPEMFISRSTTLKALLGEQQSYLSSVNLNVTRKGN